MALARVIVLIKLAVLFSPGKFIRAIAERLVVRQPATTGKFSSPPVANL